MEHVTYDNIQRWILLFQTEGSPVGEVRVLFNSWFQLLVDQVAVTRKFLGARSTFGIYQLMQARLPLETSPYNGSEIKALYEAFDRREKFDCNQSNWGRYVVVCQSLRISPDEIDRMKPIFFK